MRKKIFLVIFIASTLTSQDLTRTITEVISTNPVILERLKNYNSTKTDIQNAESEYYPKLDFSIGIGYENTQKDNRLGETSLTDNNNNPVDSIGLGTYQNTLNYTQNIFNGFATTYKVKQQQYRTLSAAYSYIEKVNGTTFEMLNSYLEVMKHEGLLKTAQENVDINTEVSSKVKKLYKAGLTTLSEVNKIESSLALARSNHVVQENTLLDFKYNLKRILGRHLDQKKMSLPKSSPKIPSNLEEASQFAIKNNPSLLVSTYNIKLAQASFKEKKAPYYPSIDIEISQSFNKNQSTIEGTDNKFSAMVNLKYNIFNGYADNAALQQSISRIHQEVESKNDIRRQVLEGLELSWAANEKLTIQLKYLEEYKDYSFKTLKLYTKEYDLGRRSLLDLLSAQNDFIGAKSQIISTTYNLLYSKYRILDALGTLVPTLINNTEFIYENVGLFGSIAENIDTLPISLDQDKDLIVDDNDICSNSLTQNMQGIYGCKTSEHVQRYSGFLFGPKTELLPEGVLKFKDLIQKIQMYDFKNLRFNIFGNVDGDLDEKMMLVLSSQRAGVLKDMLIKAGAIEKNITLHAQSNTAPLYTSELDIGKALNNRVDILVTKIK